VAGGHVPAPVPVPSDNDTRPHDDQSGAAGEQAGARGPAPVPAPPNNGTGPQNDQTAAAGGHAGAQELTRIVDRHEQLPRPLGDAQLPRRQAEQAVRRSAVEMALGQSQASVAQALHIAPQTLGDWMDRPEEARPRGRPPLPLDPLVKETVAEALDSHGRSIGLPALKQLFPSVPRSALHRFRDQWSADHEQEPCRLDWRTPGTVWSADFTQTPSPVDGVFPYVLVVRDIASQCTLLAAPCLAQAAEVVVFLLRQLFGLYAPPLVLKSDNGSPFIAAATRALCSLHGVVNLLSPPLTPRYNGSIEATAGQLKTRAALIAMQQTCEIWSSDILEAARLSANTLNRPWGPSAPTPDQRWHERSPISAARRADFAALVGRKTTDITESTQRERRQIGRPEQLTAACAATVARTAIRQALVELGILFIRRPANMSTEFNADLSRN
jgi:transposase InsO family protein